VKERDGKRARVDPRGSPATRDTGKKQDDNAKISTFPCDGTEGSFNEAISKVVKSSGPRLGLRDAEFKFGIDVVKVYAARCDTVRCGALHR